MIIDTSALLALIFQEPGAEDVLKALPTGQINTVTLAELQYKLRQKQLDVAKNMHYLEAAGLKVRLFTREEAEHSANLQVHTQPLGLSLGDRACLATAMHVDLPCLTADKAWLKLKVKGLVVRCIR